jgi:hypothetical protein
MRQSMLKLTLLQNQVSVPLDAFLLLFFSCALTTCSKVHSAFATFLHSFIIINELGLAKNHNAKANEYHAHIIILSHNGYW